MKYIPADKLIAEIERRMSENCELGEKAECFSHRAVEDNDILALIDSLQQEQPETGIELIAEERKRQIEVEGYTEEHDAKHEVQELIHAANTYEDSAKLSLLSQLYDVNDNWHNTNEPFYRNAVKDRWPWEEKYFKPTTPLRDLIKAGALIAAAIDRLNAGKEETK